MKRTRTLLAAGITGAIAASMFVPAAASTSPSSVTISGNAYAFIFGGMTNRLPGAVITVDQMPELTTVAGDNGAYEIEVPNDRDITLRATATGYQEVYTQTFHTSGEDLPQVNFQMPYKDIFVALAGVAGAELDENGNPVECAIVSTTFQQEGRALASFDAFHDFRPHGIAGSTATNAGDAAPIYFNASVYPDPTRTSTSRDGGIVWKGVKPGRYTISATNPNIRHASFVADCEPGRFINASPPWGLYGLAHNETTNEAALAAAGVELAAVPTRFGQAAKVTANVGGSDDARNGTLVLKQGDRMVGSADVVDGKATVSVPGLSVGTHTLTARYLPEGRRSWTTATTSVTVAKAATRTTLVGPKKVSRKKKATLRVTVSASGTTPTGRVTIYDGARKLRTVALTRGSATVKVRLPKKGVHRLRAVYGGSSVAETSSSSVRRIGVR